MLHSEDDRVKLAAAIALLDRGFGKPNQTVTDATTGDKVTFLHLVAMRQFSEDMHAQRAGDVVANETTIDGTATPPAKRDLSKPALE